MRTSTLEQFRRHLRPGRVYRREDLLPWSRSVDRHLKELTDDGTLQKLRTGLYYSPRKFEFGEAPADEHELVKAFLKTDRFVVTSPNAYNQLGLGTTQVAKNKTGCLQPETAWDISARQSDGHLRASHECSKATLSPNFCWLILLTNWTTSRRIATLSFLAFAKKPKRWTRESCHGQSSSSLREVFHAENISEDVATCYLTLWLMNGWKQV